MGVSTVNPYPTAIAWNTAEGGVNGTTVSTANSGGVSGTAFTMAQHSGTTQLTYTSASLNDVLSYRVVNDGSGYSNVRWNSTILGSLGVVAGVVHVSFDNIGAIASTATFVQGHSDDSDVNIVYRIRINNTGVLQMVDGSSGLIASAQGGAMVSGATYRVEWQINHSTGAYTLELFEGDSGVTHASASGTDADLTLGNTSQIRIGSITSSAWAATFDTMAIGTSKLGPRGGTNQAPTVNAGENQNVSSYDVVTLSAVVDDINDDVITTDWAQTAGSPSVTLSGSGVLRTFVAPAIREGTTLTFTATASDGTISANDAVDIVVYPHNEWVVIGGSEQPINVYGVSL